TFCCPQKRVQYGSGNPQGGIARAAAIQRRPPYFRVESKECHAMRCESSVRPSKRRTLGLRAPSYSCALLMLPMASMLVSCQGQKAASAPPPPEVQVAGVVQQDVPIYSEWVATLDGYENAQIQPQVSGYLVTQN